ncbi:unnamed protein product [Microthlaspi erraticum]|uniref:Pentacotripeptide-repeat region of PRORP domain-containing protein n=1 Tax=Microthlaspi erraticum TaxID=1685480 RepID=A0A6D2JR61_9BRAS|nr:unnamed protein product [Microthlaspi erraticum]
MEFQGIAYDLYSLNIMINCFCRRRKLGFAFSVLGKMLKLGNGAYTNLITLNTLINGVCLKGKVSEAMDLIDRMVENGCQPDAKDGRKKDQAHAAKYNIIIDGLCKDGKLDDAINLFNEMEMKGIKAMLSPTALSSEAFVKTVDGMMAQSC